MADSDHNTGPQHQLPDYRPRGMSRGDKIAAWTMGFIVLLFGIGLLSRMTGLTTAPTSNTASPKATVSAKAKAKASPSPSINPNALTIHLTSVTKWYIDAYASLHHVTEQQAAAALIQAGIKAQH